MKPFFIIVLLIYTAINAYIFYKTRQVIPRWKAVKISFHVIYFFLYSAFIIAMLGRNTFLPEVQKILYFPGTSWLGAMLYLFLFFLLTDLIF